MIVKQFSLLKEYTLNRTQKYLEVISRLPQIVQDFRSKYDYLINRINSLSKDIETLTKSQKTILKTIKELEHTTSDNNTMDTPQEKEGQSQKQQNDAQDKKQKKEAQSKKQKNDSQDKKQKNDIQEQNEPPKTQSNDDLIIQLAKEGLSAVEIARKFNQDGIINETTGKIWYWAQIEKKFRDFNISK